MPAASAFALTPSELEKTIILKLNSAMMLKLGGGETLKTSLTIRFAKPMLSGQGDALSEEHEKRSEKATLACYLKPT